MLRTVRLFSTPRAALLELHVPALTVVAAGRAEHIAITLYHGV